ncbi:hypothetical protein BASA62_000533 [Batrachochytrium salamandrivorans]|nr:hypothetical protein BASA62_000533 [Batrachochytrium salamandrivorans]
MLDCSQILEDFVPTIENVPSEIQFILGELSAKDAEFHSLKDQIHNDESALRKLIKTGPLEANSVESTSVESNTAPKTEPTPTVGSVTSTASLATPARVTEPDTPATQSSSGQKHDEVNKELDKTDLDLLSKFQRDTRAQLVGIPDQLFLYENVQRYFSAAKVLADKKVLMAEQMREMLERHTRRLNIELERLEESDALAIGLSVPSHNTIPLAVPTSMVSASAAIATAAAAVAAASFTAPSVLDFASTPISAAAAGSLAGGLGAHLLSTPLQGSGGAYLGASANESIQRIKREQLFGSDSPSSQSGHKRKLSGGNRTMIHKRSHKRKTEEGQGLFSSGVARSATPEMDEQLYCFCQQVSYGEMIACDNEECPHEWFHLECVGLAEPPNGVWFCRDCVQTNKLRKGR